MAQKIMVSICCAVYNHEKYLRKCLEGFLKQKTNFKFEILIHDDASTDNSTEIIREYEKRYPDIIKPLYQTKNQYSQGARIGWEFQYPRAKGKYIALCEGDDYWCDEMKLQRQFDEMEKNDNASICVHTVRHIKEDGTLLNAQYPAYPIDQKILCGEEAIRTIVDYEMYPFQTSSFFCRSLYIREIIESNLPDFMQVSPVGDVPLLLYLVCKGEIIYIQEVMSYYRLQSIGSWNMSLQKSVEKRIAVYKKGIASYILYDVYTEGKYSKYMESAVNRSYFLIYQIQRKYKDMLDKKYRFMLKKEPLKQPLYYYLMGIFPWMRKYWKRKRLHDGK